MAEIANTLLLSRSSPGRIDPKKTQGFTSILILQNMKLVLVFALFMILTGSCKESRQPLFEEVEDFKIEKMDVEMASLSARLRFNNPNPYKLYLKKIDCDLYIDSSFLGHFTNSAEVSIPASGTFQLPMTGTAKPMDLFKHSALAYAGKKSLMEVKGTARVGRSGFYKNVPVNFRDSFSIKIPATVK